MGITSESFGKTSKGYAATRYIIENKNGMKACVLDYGAVLQSLFVPDRDGGLRDVVWGFEKLSEYETTDTFFGAIVGRNANRIGGAEVEIGGKTYRLQKNDNGCSNLHGGEPYYSQRPWKDVAFEGNSITFTLISEDKDQGFPGNAVIDVTYTVTDDNELKIDYEAKADKDTVFNMTNHSYFNLEGPSSESVLDHAVWIDADAFTPVDEKLIPTGEIRSVEGTPLDFRAATKLGERIGSAYPQMAAAGGYDHNFALNKGQKFGLCAYAYSKKSGIKMEVYTDLPGMQLYSGNFLDRVKGGKGGRVYQRRSAVCFETQYFPDAPHHENFADTTVKKGETYRTSTVYKFTVE